jgi:putative copper export protein
VSRRRRFLAAFAPWAGLVVGILALAGVHQFGSDSTFNDCRSTSPGPLLIVAVLGLILAALSGMASWRSTRGSDSESRRVVAMISAGSAALFVFAIILAMIAALVLPPCFQ